MEISMNTNSPAAHAIVALTHKAGTAEIYINTLQRLINVALFNQDDLGMDDTEALDTVRVLSLIKRDIAAIAADQALGQAIRGAWRGLTAKEIKANYMAENHDAPTYDDTEADAQASLYRFGVKSIDLDVAFYEAAEAQKAAAEKIDRFRDLIYKTTATQTPQEGGDE